MAQWKETLEPYVKVIESVKSVALNPTAGGDLILGAVIISDGGPSEPTLITSQLEFLNTYASEELTKDYVKSLDSLYSSDPGSSLASTMWLNAYRLAGSTSLLVCRASKANGIIYTKPLGDDGLTNYIIKDSEVLKKVPPFKLILDSDGGAGGWAMAVNEVGIIGNLVTDEGPAYDYYASNLQDLIDQLNNTSKFYSPDYAFYTDSKCTEESRTTNPELAKAIFFTECYLGANFLDTTALVDEDNVVDAALDYSRGLAYLYAAEPEYSYESTVGVGEVQNLLRLNDPAFSGFVPFKYYASNLYNTKTDLSVRIRRFNHNAVKPKSTVSSEESSWEVITSILDIYVENQLKNDNWEDTHYDFYEFSILDPSVSSEPQIYNVGSIPGRGDITIEELKKSLNYIYLSLPENLLELGLNYYDYEMDNGSWEKVEENVSSTVVGNQGYTKYPSTDSLPEISQNGTRYAIRVEDGIYDIYEFKTNSKFPLPEIKVDLSLSGVETAILNVSDSDIKKAWDRIEDEDRYVVEGVTDLGNTYPEVQNYLANIAVNSNYFYPFSTANLTNYMTLANKASKITTKSHKLYAATPWDYDDGTVGFQYAVSPSVLYWETVSRNRRNNNEFAGVFGQNTGRVSVMNLAKNFTKSERQLLLTKRINTISYDNYLGIYHFNDNYTFTEESNVMSEECNARLQIRISKAMPIILNQFKGRQNTAKTWNEMREVVDYWFRSTVMTYNYTIAEYRIICDETNNSPETIRQNKVFVTVQVRFNSSIKYITVYNDAFPIGVEFAE